MGSTNSGAAGTPGLVSVIMAARGIDGCAMAKDRG
jgi:hypothetical protein